MYSPKDHITFPDIPADMRGDVERVSVYLYRYTYPYGPAWIQISELNKRQWRQLARFVIDGR